MPKKDLLRQKNVIEQENKDSKHRILTGKKNVAETWYIFKGERLLEINHIEKEDEKSFPRLTYTIQLDPKGNIVMFSSYSKKTDEKVRFTYNTEKERYLKRIEVIESFSKEKSRVATLSTASDGGAEAITIGEYHRASSGRY